MYRGSLSSVNEYAHDAMYCAIALASGHVAIHFSIVYFIMLETCMCLLFLVLYETANGH